MLDVLSDGFSRARDRFRGKTVLSADNIDQAVDDIRKSLLEADVEYSVAKSFLEQVKKEALGLEVNLKAGRGDHKMRVTPGDHFVQICQKELEKLMGPPDPELILASNRPTVIMMVGLQGSGKTTTTGKLARYLSQKKQSKPLLVAADIYRPAAAEQLKVLGSKVGAPVFHLPGLSPVALATAGLQKAFELGRDVVLVDTAGRLTIDEALMAELDQIKAAVRPDNILFVCDAMMGQDAVTTAKAFDDRLGLTGFIMTKLDGDARGGAALSIKGVTGKPIKFLGMGEDLERLEEFRPEGLASRILGMGDIVGLMQDFERVVDADQEVDALRMLQGQFSFKDFYEQLSMIQRMGPLKDIISKLPMQGMLPKDVNLDDRELVKIKAMIDSMTAEERLNPKVFNEGRVRRVAKGSGRPAKEVAELLKRFLQMRQMMGSLGKNLGLMGKIPGLSQLGKLGNMAQAAKAMAGQGGMPGMPPGMGDLGAMFSGMGAGGAAARRPVDRDKLKKLRKDAKKARKKNRNK